MKRILLVLGAAAFLVAQEQEPKFLLSDVEAAQLESLTLRAQIIRMQQKELDVAASEYANRVLTAHHNPPNVIWSAATLQFMYKRPEVKPEVKKEK